MDKETAILKATEYKKLVLKNYDLHSLYLYGSFANGNFHENSDIDIAIIINSTNEDFMKYSSKAWKLRRLVDINIEPVVILANTESPLLDEVYSNGIKI